jgi:putative ATP-binding cassette transporter
MALPYFRESKRGCFLLAGLLTLTVAQAGVTVAISYLNKDFYNVLVAKDVTKFYVVLGKYLAAFLVGSPITVLYNYQRDQLAVHWREWMTARTFSRYLAGRVYYKLERQEDIDNPDQRISEDINSFTSYSLELGITCLTSFIDLLSFSAILWSIYPVSHFLATVSIMQGDILSRSSNFFFLPKALLGVTLVYAGLGTLLTAYLGRTLFGLNFAQLNKEADLRYALVRLRENSESIAFYAGEDLEGELIERRATGVMNNRRKINKAQRNLEFFTVMYGYLVQVLPVVSPANRIEH